MRLFPKRTVFLYLFVLKILIFWDKRDERLSEIGMDVIQSLNVGKATLLWFSRCRLWFEWMSWKISKRTWPRSFKVVIDFVEDFDSLNHPIISNLRIMPQEKVFYQIKLIYIYIYIILESIKWWLTCVSAYKNNFLKYF